MTFVLILFVSSTSYPVFSTSHSMATVPGYVSLDQCKAAGKEAQEADNSKNTRFICISEPGK